jgi:hypothetical protein
VKNIYIKSGAEDHKEKYDKIGYIKRLRCLAFQERFFYDMIDVRRDC